MEANKKLNKNRCIHNAELNNMINPHSQFIDKRISDLKKSKKWNTLICGSHDSIITDFASNIFTNLVQSTFTKSYLKKHPCSDCNGKSEERCHGIGEERPLLIKRALERIYPDTSLQISIKDILIAFLEEHKSTRFTFKCKPCHRKESARIVN